MKVKEESEKVGLQLNIQKTKIMASGPITSWEIDGERVETRWGNRWGKRVPWTARRSNTFCHPAYLTYMQSTS